MLDYSNARASCQAIFDQKHKILGFFVFFDKKNTILPILEKILDTTLAKICLYFTPFCIMIKLTQKQKEG